MANLLFWGLLNPPKFLWTEEFYLTLLTGERLGSFITAQRLQLVPEQIGSFTSQSELLLIEKRCNNRGKRTFCKLSILSCGILVTYVSCVFHRRIVSTFHFCQFPLVPAKEDEKSNIKAYGWASAFQASIFMLIRNVKLWNFICKSVPESSFSSIGVFKNFLKQTLTSLLRTTFDLECPCTWSLVRSCACYRS